MVATMHTGIGWMDVKLQQDATTNVCIAPLRMPYAQPQPTLIVDSNLWRARGGQRVPLGILGRFLSEVPL